MTEEEVTPDIKKLRQEYILSYSKRIEFESINKGKGDEKLKVWGKYYCLFDNAIVVPGKYNFDDTTKSFTTHNFAEDIVITSNGDTILKKSITKKDFLDKLPQYLKDYAVIFEPKFEGYEYAKPILIGEDVWLGGNAIICPGVTIGNRSVIDAGSVVTKNIPDVFAAGNPCKVVRALIE